MLLVFCLQIVPNTQRWDVQLVQLSGACFLQALELRLRQGLALLSILSLKAPRATILVTLLDALRMLAVLYLQIAPNPTWDVQLNRVKLPSLLVAIVLVRLRQGLALLSILSLKAPSATILVTLLDALRMLLVFCLQIVPNTQRWDVNSSNLAEPAFSKRSSSGFAKGSHFSPS